MDDQEKMKKLNKMMKMNTKDTAELTELLENKGKNFQKEVHAVINQMIVRTETIWQNLRSLGREQN